MIYKPSTRESAIIYIDKCFEKKRWIKIEPLPEAKTLNQLRYIWLVLTIIGDDTGNTSQDIYDYYLKKFPTFKEVTVHGDTQRVLISMSKFTIEQMSVFIDRVVIEARQEGHVIPDPSDKVALEAYNYYKTKGLL